MKCPKCGYENKPHAAMCSSCYFELNSTRVPQAAPTSASSTKMHASPIPTQTPAAAAQPSAPNQPASPYGPPPGTQQQPSPYGAPPTPYQAPVPGPAIQFLDYAGFWSRVGAMLIDSIPFVVIGFIVASILVAQSAGAQSSPQGTGLMSMHSGMQSAGRINQVLGAMSYILMNGALGATLGKMALGLKIVKTDGSPIGFGRAAVRYVMEILLAAVTCGLAYIAVAVTEKKQGLHDMIAGTVVVHDR